MIENKDGGSTSWDPTITLPFMFDCQLGIVFKITGL